MFEYNEQETIPPEIGENQTTEVDTILEGMQFNSIILPKEKEKKNMR